MVAADGSVYPPNCLFLTRKAVLVPVGAGLGIEFLAPARSYWFANTNGLPLYSWSDIDLKNGKLDLVAETDSSAVLGQTVLYSSDDLLVSTLLCMA